MHEANQDLEAAVAFAIDMALVAGQKTAKAADDLVAMVSHDPDAQANVRAYVEGFKTNLTGNYYWSYVSCLLFSPAAAFFVFFFS